ncbi:MAG: hypothetical protein ACKVVT_04575 [Dehalococcoidia bacterium]
MRADTSDVAFRLLLALGDLWKGLQGAHIDPTSRGLHLTTEFLGGYTRYSAGPAANPRFVVEWSESTRHLRVIRWQEWHGAEAVISSTVQMVRTEAKHRGIADIVDRSLLSACQEPSQTSRRTVVAGFATPAVLAPAGRRIS